MSEKEFNEFALKNAIASVEFEGYEYTADEKELCRKAADGSISKDDLIKILLERCTV